MRNNMQEKYQTEQRERVEDLTRSFNIVRLMIERAEEFLPAEELQKLVIREIVLVLDSAEIHSLAGCPVCENIERLKLNI